MPLAALQKRMFLADSPYLKHIGPELDEPTGIICENATNPARPAESEEFVKYTRMRSTQQEFYDYAGMSVDTFDLLLSKIECEIAGAKTNSGYLLIPAELRLILTLRFLITSESHSCLSRRFNIGRTTSADIVNDVSSAICYVLTKEYIPAPTKERWIAIADDFYRKTRFPNCLGVLQGVNITQVTRKLENREKHMNKFLFMFLETVIDSDGVIVTKNIGGIFEEDERATRMFYLSEAISRREMNLPPKMFSLHSTTRAPCVLLADEQFPATAHILKVSGEHNEKKLLNEKIELAKKKPESIFKKMMSRFTALKKPMTCNEKIARTLLQAVCVIHNFTLAHDGADMLDGAPDPGDNWPTVKAIVIDDNIFYDPTACEEAMKVRQIFHDHFVRHEGKWLPFESA